jgi:hypothetical protein
MNRHITQFGFNGMCIRAHGCGCKGQRETAPVVVRVPKACAWSMTAGRDGSLVVRFNGEGGEEALSVG